MAVFVAFEGVEGSGKTTQARLLYERILAWHYQAVLVREPGTTALGDYLRIWLKENPATPLAELFLFCAARAQLVTEVINPSLANGIHVVTDRYSASTIAYQGHGRELGQKALMAVIDFATSGLEPDLYVLMDIDPRIALGRISIGATFETPETQEAQEGLARVDDEGQRFEKESMAFHQRVRDSYLSLADASPEQWLILDATKSIEELARLILARVSDLFSNNSSAI